MSNSIVSQPHRCKYIIYVITVSSPRRRLVCCPVSLVVRWQSGHRGLSLLSLSPPLFLFDPGSHRWRPESAPERMKTSSQVSVPPRRSRRPTASRRWSLRRWSPASFLSEGLQFPLDTGDEDKLYTHAQLVLVAVKSIVLHCTAILLNVYSAVSLLLVTLSL